jgi:hypothetical protein
MSRMSSSGVQEPLFRPTLAQHGARPFPIRPRRSCCELSSDGSASLLYGACVAVSCDGGCGRNLQPGQWRIYNRAGARASFDDADSAPQVTQVAAVSRSRRARPHPTPPHQTTLRFRCLSVDFRGHRRTPTSSRRAAAIVWGLVRWRLGGVNLEFVPHGLRPTAACAV